jgi:predicted RNA polymerase sigma factor
VLLPDQDRTRWDRLLIARGLKSLERAEALSASERGPYTLQAQVAACHARAMTASETDWRRIAALYLELEQQAPSAVVKLNRAVAVSMAEGPGAALALVDQLVDEPALREYPFLPSVRGDLLARLGRFDEARSEFERVAELTQNERQREQAKLRAASCASRVWPPKK